MMPVRKFRGIEDMDEAGWHPPGSAEWMRAMEYLGALAKVTNRRRFPPGVHRHRSIEEMNRVQEEWSRRRGE